MPLVRGLWVCGALPRGIRGNGDSLAVIFWLVQACMPKRLKKRGSGAVRRSLFEGLERRELLSAVVGRYLFYANSPAFDAGGNDDAAIATDKSALLPGQSASFANYSSYGLGLNAIMVDISGLAGGTSPSAADFSFKIGNSNTPDSWQTAPAPASILTRPGAGFGGAARVEVLWPNQAISDEWLQVTVRADATTGLAQDSVFYFGNAIGDTGDSLGDAMVTATDEQGVRTHPSTILNPAGINSPYDFNRDGKVDAVDMILARNNTTGVSTALQWITPNAAPTVRNAASAGAGIVTSTATTLSVLGADDGGESGLTYAWSVSSAPVGAHPVFASNGINVAKNTTVTFDNAGTYTFLVTISDGVLSTTSSVSLRVQQTVSSVAVSPVSGGAMAGIAPAAQIAPATSEVVAQASPSSQSQGVSLLPFEGSHFAIPQPVAFAGELPFYRTSTLSPFASIPDIFDVEAGDSLGDKMRKKRWQQILPEALESRLHLSGDSALSSAAWAVNVGNDTAVRYRTLPVLQSALQDGVTGTGLQPQLSAAQNFFNVRNLLPRNQAITVTTPPSGNEDGNGTGADLSVVASFLLGEPNLNYTWTTNGQPAGSTVEFADNADNAAKQTHVTFDRAGLYAFVVHISNGPMTVSDSVNLTVGADLTTITAGPASQINVDGSQQFTAVALDQFGQPMIAQPAFNWSVDGGGVGTVDGTGLYSAGPSAGNATVRASVGTVSGSAAITLVHNAPTVANPAQSGASNVTGTSTTLSVLGASDLGESGLTYSWAMTGGPQGATPQFTGNATNAAKNTAVTFNEAGNYTFTVTISDGTLFTTSSVSLTVAQSLSSISVAPGSQGLNLNGSQQFAATGKDQFGAVLAVQPTFAWGIDSGGAGSVNSAGLYASGATAGSATVRASAGGVSGTATVSVTNASPIVSTAAHSGASTVTGASTTLAVLGADDGGEGNLSYSWGITAAPNGATPQFSINGTNAAKNVTVTFNEAGSYTFTVTISDGTLSTTSSVSLTVSQTLTSIVLTPPGKSMNLNGSQQFAATGKDQFGTALAAQPTFSWSVDGGGVGGVNATGFYSAGTTADSATVRATSGTVSGTASVTVTNAAPTVSIPAQAGTSNVTTTSTSLSVLGADDAGEGHLTYAWSMTAGPTGATPQFSINGTNGAKNSTVTFNKAGSYTFLVTISDGSLSVTSSVSLTVAQTLTAIGVTPGSAALNTNASQNFLATALDQFGSALTGQPVFVWSVDNGGVGSVNASGVYAAGGTAGNATVRATSGGISGTATATVSSAGTAVTVTTHTMSSFTELVITGTSGFDTISVSQSGNTFTIVSNGNTQTITGTFGDLAIHAGSGGSAITVNASVTINTLVYGGAGADTINDGATGFYNAVITIGGGNDTVTGNGVNTNYWADTGDTLHASAAETNGFVHQVSAFYQPFSSDPNNAQYIPLTLAGQNLPDPTDSGTETRLPNNSLWGLGPQATDVNQGSVDDCYFLASLAGWSMENPQQLMNYAVDLGDGTYAVEMFTDQVGPPVWNGTRFVVTNTFTPVFIRVDGDLSGSGGSLAYNRLGSTGDLWASILEKAFALHRTGSNTYASLNIGDPGEVYTDFGRTSTTASYGAASSYASQVMAALASGEIVTVGTNASINGGAPLIVSHSYTLVNITLVSATYMITLRNPWGYDGAGNDGNPGDGLVTVSFSILSANTFETELTT